MTNSCCKDTQIKAHVEIINVKGYYYKVTIVHCVSCGSLKSMSNIAHEK
jgi:hypothetical protein